MARRSLKDEFQKLQRSEIERLRAWLYFIVFCCLITFLSHQPGDPSRIPPFPHFDKLIHFIEYFVFGILLQRALTAQAFSFLEANFKRVTAVVLLVTAVFAAFDEVHQYFVPFRTMDIWDWLADLAGASFAILVYQSTRPNSRRYEIEG